ncbi:MAG: 23S rRNA (pseudouridine(1915)-N(3))-methyltransferase RlmH [Solirubrobacteraceae bacterium]
MRITVVAVGRLRPPYVDDLAHYTRMIGRYAQIEIVEVRSDAQLGARIPDRAFVCLLEVGGVTLDSVAFSHFIQQRRDSGVSLCFALGGPFGELDLPRVDQRLSLGAMTLPHQLARVVLLEQLYRAHKIIAGEPYHH